MKAQIPTLAILVLAVCSAGAQEESRPLLLTGARVLDAAGERLLEGLDVLVVGGRITQVSPASEMKVAQEALRLDLDGLALLPGLIDLHSHRPLHPYDEAAWEDQVLKESLELRTIRAVAAARYADWKPGMPEPPRIQASREMFARALKSGVTIACRSDVGVFAHGDNVRELELMVGYGMSPTEALRAAAGTAARVLGRERDLGRIADGCVADLIATRGDPLKDVTALRRPLVVVKEGQIVLDGR